MSAGRRRRTPAWVSRAVAVGVLVVVLIVAAVLLLRSRAQTGTQYQTAQATKGTLTVRWRVAGTVVAKYSIKVT